MDGEMSGGRYADVLDVADFLASEYGSRVNAIAVMCRDSKLYQQSLRRMRRRNGKAVAPK